MIKVAVTGASGFIGSRICKDLAERNYIVHAVVRDSAKGDLVKKIHPNIQPFIVPDLVTGDYTESFKGCKYVIHTATPLRFEADDPENEIIKPAVEGTLNVLKASLKAGVQRVVFTSTMATMCGTQREKNPDHVWTEDDWNDAPGTHYSRSKTLAEKAAWDFVKQNPGIELVTIHPSFVIGPPTIPRFEAFSIEPIIELLNGKYKESGVPARLYGLVDVRDVSLAHILACEKPEAANNRFIVGSKDQFSMFELNNELKKVFPQYADRLATSEQKPTSPKKNGTDNSKVQRVLGLKFTPLETTLKDTVETLISMGVIKQ